MFNMYPFVFQLFACLFIDFQLPSIYSMQKIITCWKSHLSQDADVIVMMMVIGDAAADDDDLG